MWGMNAVTALELEAERRREVLLADASRPRATRERTGARALSLAHSAASLAQGLALRLSTPRI